MIYLTASILLVVNTLALAMVVLGLPGTWLMVAATGAAAWWRWEEAMFSPWTLGALLALAVLGEVAEFAAGAAGSKRAGGTWRGSLGAIAMGFVGGILGTFLIYVPVVGSILGAAAGAFAGALAGELWGGKSLDPAIRVGQGAFVGRITGTALKLAFAVAIWLVATVASLL